MRVRLGTVPKKYEFVALLSLEFSMQRQMRHKRQTRIVHADERCKRMRPHDVQRLGAVFGIELRGLVHGLTSIGFN